MTLFGRVNFDGLADRRAPTPLELARRDVLMSLPTVDELVTRCRSILPDSCELS